MSFCDGQSTSSSTPLLTALIYGPIQTDGRFPSLKWIEKIYLSDKINQVRDLMGGSAPSLVGLMVAPLQLARF